MKKLLLTTLFCLYMFCAGAQCSISPFIQQNYEFDAKILVLREIQNNPSDPDYDNPFISQVRMNGYLEKLSAIYQNPNNSMEIDSLFNEFQFHADAFTINNKFMRFTVDTNVSWVQALKDTGTTNVTAIDDFFDQYQFSVTEFTDYTSGNYAGKTLFVISTGFDVLNTQALDDDLENTTSNEIEVINSSNIFAGNPCNYTGIYYEIPDYDLLVPVYLEVKRCDISMDASNVFWFTLSAYCPSSPVNQYRYVTVSNDCSQVNFSRTLSTEDLILTNVSVYPNPASNTLNIQGIDQIESIKIYSILGKNIPVSLQNNAQIDIRSLKNGIYFLKVTDSQKRSILKKFIKK